MDDLLGGFSPETPVAVAPAPVAPAAVQSGADLVEAVFDYEGQSQGDLSFKIGDKIQVTSRNGDIWSGTSNGKSGNFPAMHVQSVNANDPGNDDILGKALQSNEKPAPISAGFEDNLFGAQQVTSSNTLSDATVTAPVISSSQPQSKPQVQAQKPPQEESTIQYAKEVGLVVDDGGSGGRRPFQDDPEWYLTQLVNALPTRAVLFHDFIFPFLNRYK